MTKNAIRYHCLVQRARCRFFPGFCDESFMKSGHLYAKLKVRPNVVEFRGQILAIQSTCFR